MGTKYSTKQYGSDEIGKVIVALREERKIHQDDLAKDLTEILGINIGRSTVNGWENGIRAINSTHIVALADYFDVSTDFLLGRSELSHISKEIKTAVKTTGISEKSVQFLSEGSEEAKAVTFLIDFILSRPELIKNISDNLYRIDACINESQPEELGINILSYAKSSSDLGREWEYERLSEDITMSEEKALFSANRIARFLENALEVWIKEELSECDKEVKQIIFESALKKGGSSDGKQHAEDN